MITLGSEMDEAEMASFTCAIADSIFSHNFRSESRVDYNSTMNWLPRSSRGYAHNIYCDVVEEYNLFGRAQKIS